MNVLFNLFSSVIIPGIIWDILKTGTECSIQNIIEKFSMWNISDKEAEEIKQLIDDLKFKNISSKKELRIFFKKSDLYKLNIHFKKRDTYSFHTEGNDNTYNFNINNKSKKHTILLLIFIIIVFAIVALTNLILDSKTKTSENAEFTNKYVFGTYDGLIKKNNTPTAFQKMDTEFYFNESEREKGNYVRILQFSIHYDFSDIEWDVLEDSYESILISLCDEYNNAELKRSEEDAFTYWTFMDNRKGLFIDIRDRYSNYTDFNNTLIYEYKDGFLMEKCLYFGEYDIIVVILSCCENTYEKLNNIKGSELLLNCFESFKQIYNENIFVKSDDFPNKIHR